MKCKCPLSVSRVRTANLRVIFTANFGAKLFIDFPPSIKQCRDLGHSNQPQKALFSRSAHSHARLFTTQYSILNPDHCSYNQHSVFLFAPCS